MIKYQESVTNRRVPDRLLVSLDVVVGGLLALAPPLLVPLVVTAKPIARLHVRIVVLFVGWSESEVVRSGTGPGFASRRAARDATLGYAFPAFGCSAALSGSSAGAIIEREVSR